MNIITQNILRYGFREFSSIDIGMVGFFVVILLSGSGRSH
jgi:hypothetical protein